MMSILYIFRNPKDLKLLYIFCNDIKYLIHIFAA